MSKNLTHTLNKSPLLHKFTTKFPMETNEALRRSLWNFKFHASKQTKTSQNQTKPSKQQSIKHASYFTILDIHFVFRSLSGQPSSQKRRGSKGVENTCREPSRPCQRRWRPRRHRLRREGVVEGGSGSGSRGPRGRRRRQRRRRRSRRSCHPW